jgi:hypothetical protein
MNLKATIIDEPVPGEHYANVMPHRFHRLRQTAGHIADASGLDERIGFGGYEEYTHWFWHGSKKNKFSDLQYNLRISHLRTK